MLYGVTGDGNIVTIDTKTGQATTKSKLSDMLKAGVTQATAMDAMEKQRGDFAAIRRKMVAD